MPQNPSEARPPTSPLSPTSSDPLPPEAPTPESPEERDPRELYLSPPESPPNDQSEAPSSLLHGQASQPRYRGLPNPAHPALLLVAEPDGQLKPEFREWEADLPLQAGSLVPKWYPWVWEGLELSPDERQAQFRSDLTALLAPPNPTSSKEPQPSGTALPTPPSLKPQDILQSLYQLLSVVRPV